MLRALWLFVLLAVIGIVAAWFAGLPGSVVITLRARDTYQPASAGFARAWRECRNRSDLSLRLDVRGDAGRVHALSATRRRHRGFVALTRGLVAVAAGDGEDARRQTKRALALVGEPPLALLLAAQSAALDGDDEQAQRFYTQNAAVEGHGIPGLRGLYLAAARRGDSEQAISIAERALTLRPKTPWAINALFELQSGKRAWESATTALDAAARAKLIDSSIAKRRRAVLATAAAKDADARGDNATALARAQDALGFAPGFAPAALIAAKHLSAQGGSGKRRA